MDFSKAFDKVAHNKLISSLHGYGIDSEHRFWDDASTVDEGCFQNWSLDGTTSNVSDIDR